MNERYLYKGKNVVDETHWIEGCFYLDEDNDAFIYNKEYKSSNVHRDTICQFTGFKAKNRKRNLDERVWENDVFRSSEERDEGDVVTYHVVMWINQLGAFYMVPVAHYEIMKEIDVSNEKEFSWLFEDAFLNDFSLDVGLVKVGDVFSNPEFLA